VRKTYVALCRGVAPEHGRINVRLKTISTVTRHFAVPHPGGKDAVTEFKRLALLQQPSLSAGHGVADAIGSSSSAYSLLLVTPVTGRMHQIRAHLNHIGHPLDGDGRCALQPPALLLFVPQSAALNRYAPRGWGGQASQPSRLFLHSASVCASFETADCNMSCIRAIAELPLQLKQRLAALGGQTLDAEISRLVAAAVQHV
jgi:23S rRNA-/tRNA-specific pseudouridylate synthase